MSLVLAAIKQSDRQTYGMQSRDCTKSLSRSYKLDGVAFALVQIAEQPLGVSLYVTLCPLVPKVSARTLFLVRLASRQIMVRFSTWDVEAVAV